MEQQQIIFEVYCRDCYGGFGCAADKESHHVKRGKDSENSPRKLQRFKLSSIHTLGETERI